MLEQIIEKFCNQSKFINDFDGLTQYLDGLDFEEKNKILSEVFDYNSKMYTLMVEENKKLEQIINRVNITKDRKEIPTIENEVYTTGKIESLKLDVSAYITRIKKCEDLSELKNMISNMTSVNTVIVLRLVEEMFDIKKMLYQERNSIDEDTKIYFENEIDKLKIKIEYLKQIIGKNQKKNVEKENEEIENEIIFLKTNYGNVCALSDIKDIPIDFYDLFYGLLESIRLGTLKKLKTFLEIDAIKGISEVKDDQARVIFDRIGKNTYIVLAMFIKKVDNDAGYRAFLTNRSDLYIQNKETITSLALSNNEFIEENRNIKNKIYSILKKVKKKGEIND